MRNKSYAYKKASRRTIARLIDAVGYVFRTPSERAAADPKKILVVRLDQLGDIVQTLPAFKSLRSSFPKSEIHFLTTSIGKQLNDLCQVADQVYVWDCPWFDGSRKPNVSPRAVGEWIRQHKFDWALELRGDARLIAMLRIAGIKNIVGYGATGGGFLLDVEVPWSVSTHAIDRNLALVEAIGGQVRERAPSIFLEATSKRGERKIAIHPDAGTSAKRWPIASFVQTIDALAGDGAEVVLVGLNEQLGEDILKQIKTKATNKMGKTNFAGLAALLNECDGLLSNDSGPAHLMAALGKPVWLVWSGTADPNAWAPRGKEVKLFSNPVPCAPCSLPECPISGHPCMTHIKPETVIHGIRESL